ncbi:hypothetical protein [Sphingobacterium chungjuense]|uniref:hypothetical protein n=1 Tax=Sphingobacterium chungjuense TaxID=2675553 RepID=UPI001409D25B|nr:hypothetical protein [Sphingobacterium chungjuense]
MACLKSITKYSKQCAKQQGGASELWLISYSDLKNVDGSLEKYSTDSTGNVIDEIGLATGKKYVSVGLIKNTLGITEEYASTPETNSFTITSTLNLYVSGITPDGRNFISELVEAGAVSALVKLKSGRFVALGLTGMMDVSAISGTSGVNSGDGAGYTITLTSDENHFLHLVDPTIITGLIEA